MILPWVSYRPLSFVSKLDRRRLIRAAILHTNGSYAKPGATHVSLLNYFNSRYALKRERVGAHFQVMNDGTVEQYCDTDLVVYHAYGASNWAIGIETEDNGDRSQPWNAAQLNSIDHILRDLGIPSRWLLEAQSEGIGFHEQYPSWNQAAHDCPGTVREQQIRNVVLPKLAGPQGGLSMDAEVKAAFDAINRRIDALTGLVNLYGRGDVVGPDDDPHDAVSNESIRREIVATRTAVEALHPAVGGKVMVSGVLDLTKPTTGA